MVAKKVLFFKLLTCYIFANLFVAIHCADATEGPEINDDKAWLKTWAHLAKYSYDDYNPLAGSASYNNIEYNYEDPSPVPCCDPKPESRQNKSYDEMFFQDDNEISPVPTRSSNSTHFETELSNLFEPSTDWGFGTKVPMEAEPEIKQRKMKKPGLIFQLNIL